MGWWASGFALCVLVGPWVSACACAFVFACAPCVLTSACGFVGLVVFGRWCVCSWLACSGLCAWGVSVCAHACFCIGMRIPLAAPASSG